MKFKNVNNENLQTRSQKDRREIGNDDEFESLAKILFVIVLYKVNVAESITFQSLNVAVKFLSANKSADLLICDNSPEPQLSIGNVSKESQLNIIYLHDHNNPGISLSYNRAADLAIAQKKKWMLVLDHDTILPVNAIASYIDSLRSFPDYPLYSPKLFSNNVLLSPCKYILYRGSHLPSIDNGPHKLKRKNVLNSGLLINLYAYKKVGGYDDKVWLYYSDFVFFDRLKKYFEEFIVVDCDIQHNLSSSDYTDYSFSISRFKYYCKGAREASKSADNTIAYLSYGFTVGAKTILMCKRFKSLKFLEVFYKFFIFGV